MMYQPLQPASGQRSALSSGGRAVDVSPRKKKVQISFANSSFLDGLESDSGIEGGAGSKKVQAFV